MQRDVRSSQSASLGFYTLFFEPKLPPASLNPSLLQTSSVSRLVGTARFRPAAMAAVP